jgi:apolipoprotein D and lipocalin family protein
MALAFAVQSASPPATVDQVDLARYMGTYYEVARFPNRFQTQCLGDVTATYSLRPDGRVDVVNRCRLADGSMEEARGVARRAGKNTSNARLEVRFAPAFLSFLPQVWGDYWILGLGPDYGYSVVGSPDRQYLWILSRTPTMSEEAYGQALAIAASNGYDTSRLERTPQRVRNGVTPD